jgi:hypothetical protein
MTNIETVQALWDRAKQRAHTLEELTQLFNDYKETVNSLTSSTPEYKAALHYTPQEWPDLDRLIGKKHDLILKGRLIDAITNLKKKVGEIEAQVVEEQPIPDELLDVAPPRRNIPNLGME